MEPGFVLAGIQMPPAALDVVMQGRDGLALRTGERAARLLGEPHMDRFCRVIELDSRDSPGVRDS
jgi:hypothetical protein